MKRWRASQGAPEAAEMINRRARLPARRSFKRSFPCFALLLISPSNPAQKHIHTIWLDLQVKNGREYILAPSAIKFGSQKENCYADVPNLEPHTIINPLLSLKQLNPRALKYFSSNFFFHRLKCIAEASAPTFHSFYFCVGFWRLTRVEINFRDRPRRFFRLAIIKLHTRHE